MLKLSKISKMVLFSGMLLAFSSGFASAILPNTSAIPDPFAGITTNYAADHNPTHNGTTTVMTAGQSTFAKTEDGVTQYSGGNEKWRKAAAGRQAANDDYASKAEAYNRCLAGGGDCSSQKQAMDAAKSNLDAANKEYKDAQKEASKEYNVQLKAENKAKAKQEKENKKALKNAEKELKQAQKDLKKCQKEVEKGKKAAGECAELEKAVSEKGAAVDAAKDKVNGGSSDGSSSSSGNNELDALKQNVADGNDGAFRQLENYAKAKQAEAEAAAADCKRYSAMTSSDAQAKAREACQRAAALEQEAADAAAAVEELRSSGATSWGKAITAGEKSLKTTDYLKTGGASSYIASDTTAGRAITIGGDGADTLAGYRSKYYTYEGGADVLEAITRRAARIVVGLKPIVYIFAGFGLIAFAWMAIFNKLSWKWFANIAMGLFLVANMGRLIEYFVAGESKHYNIGTWTASDTVNPQTNLANAFKDSYYVYGQPVERKKDLEMFNLSKDGGASSDIVAEEFKADAAGFCKGTSGSGWANFKSCIGDIVSTAKKVANTVQTVKAVAEDVVDRAETVVATAKHIGEVAKNMKGASLSEIVSNAGIIFNDVNNMVSTTTGAIGSITNATSTISNNIQDMGKSTAQQQELAERRARGEATNAVDALIKGQEYDKSTGGVEKVDGDYAGKDSFFTKANDFAKDVNNKSNDVNSGVQGVLGQVGAVTDVMENTSIRDITGFGSDKTWNDARRDKKEEKHQNQTKQDKVERQKDIENQLVANAEEQAKKRTEDKLAYEQQQSAQRDAQQGYYAEQDYNKAVENADKLYDKANNLEQEAKNLEKEAQEKQQKANDACAKDPNSSVCTTAKTAASAAKDAAENTKQQAEQAKKDYNAAKQEVENAYNNSVKAGANQAQNDYNKAQAQAEEAKRQMDEANAKMDEAKSAADSAKKDYNNAVSEAGDAKAAYENAKNNGASAEEIAKLKAEYEAKLKAMNDADKANKKAQSEYSNVQNQQKQAEKDYNNATNNARDASERLASYTNEDVNNTGESRKNTKEDTYNDMLVNQYQSETNPNAVAQASRNSYSEQKNKTDIAKDNLSQKQYNAEQAKKDYEAALEKAQKTGDEEDIKAAERLKQNYELAQNEVETAQNEYNDLNVDLVKYQIDYLKDAISAEEYKQQIYSSDMQKASNGINQYEKAVNAQLKVVDAAATKYTQANSNLDSSNSEEIERVAKLYNEYKQAKDVYDEYRRSLSAAKNAYQTAQNNYNATIQEIARLKKALQDIQTGQI